MMEVAYYAGTYRPELYHHGILGQKWGRRRYQYEDGSYKPGAEGRYYDEVGDRKGLRKVFKKKSSADVEEAVKKEKQLSELERMRAQNAKYRADTERLLNDYKGQTVQEVIDGKPEEKKKGMSFTKKLIIGGALVAGGVILYKKFGGSDAAKDLVSKAGSAAKSGAKKAGKAAADIGKEAAEAAAEDAMNKVKPGGGKGKGKGKEGEGGSTDDGGGKTPGTPDKPKPNPKPGKTNKDLEELKTAMEKEKGVSGSRFNLLALNVSEFVSGNKRTRAGETFWNNVSKNNKLAQQSFDDAWGEEYKSGGRDYVNSIVKQIDRVSDWTDV